MKKTLTLTVMTLLAGAMSGYSQGQLSIAEVLGGSFAIQVWGQQSLAASTVAVAYNGYTTKEVMGDSSNPNNTWIAAGNTATATYTGSALGAGNTVQLLAASGSGDALSSLVPVPAANGGIITTWYTGNSLTGQGGYWAGLNTVTLGYTGAATVAIAAWNNEGGTVSSLAAAQAAGDPWGISSLGTIELTTAPTTPGLLPIPGNPAGIGTYVSGGIESFSLGVVPEPSTIALGVIGASALLFRRRK